MCWHPVFCISVRYVALCIVLRFFGLLGIAVCDILGLWSPWSCKCGFVSWSVYIWLVVFFCNCLGVRWCQYSFLVIYSLAGCDEVISLL